MTNPDRVLKTGLRVFGGTGLFALVAVVMPISWMAATHRCLGLGDMPSGPVVEYLARSLSAFYALFSALCLIVAANVERYRSLIQWLGVLCAVFGIVLTGIDLAAGMPWWWSAVEGPPTIAVGLSIYWLARAGSALRHPVISPVA